MTFVAVDESKAPEREPCKDPAPIYRIVPLSTLEPEGRLHGRTEGATLWDSYTKAVSGYTRRNLTFDTDALRAFAGIEQMVARGVNIKFWHGLPEFAFERSLLWYPAQMVERREQGNQVLFPSWSWAAWKGEVSYRGKGWRNSRYHGPVSVVNWLR